MDRGGAHSSGAPRARARTTHATYTSLHTSQASEIVRRNPRLIHKFRPMQSLTEKVMGSADFMPNPCVIVCPFAGAGCAHGTFRMNGACKPSQVRPLACPLACPHTRFLPPPNVVCPRQLYSHWQHVHSGNPTARQLEARWRAAIKNKSLSLADLDVCAPVQWTGDEEAGYEPLRAAPTAAQDAFPHSSPPGSSGTGGTAQLHEWLEATDTL